MQVKYIIFNSWRDLESRSESKDFIYFETHSGKIIALDYESMRKLFVTNSKNKFLEVTALIISELGKALEKGLTAGAIEL